MLLYPLKHFFRSLPLFSLVIFHATSLMYAREAKKPWTFIVNCAADNDLYSFAGRNMKQMESIGSNPYINIVVQLDMHLPGHSKLTKRYFVQKNKSVQVDSKIQGMDSGDSKTLIDLCAWAAQEYPAEEYALIFWNHGTGIIDPVIPRTINPSELFSFNPSTKMIELDRSIGFLDYVNSILLPPNIKRGICFDATTNNYLTNQKLEEGLDTVCSQVIHKKFALIGFDACLMSMLEIDNIIKKYAHFRVGSEDAELGTGWGYADVLAPFATGNLTPQDFAKNIVYAYEKTYSKITHDYTQSAVNLQHIEALEENVHQVASLLLEALRKQRNHSVKDVIKISRNKLYCTQFSEPSYLDLHHFYFNLHKNCERIELTHNYETVLFKQTLKENLQHGMNLINTAVIANTAGKNLKNAKGIAIYFPERRLHTSYKSTNFATKNNWFIFLGHYLLL